MNKTILGLSGYSRAGKNLFADICSSVLEEKYKCTCKQFALAYALKKDCESFLKEKLNLDVWTEVTEEKSKFRELLVWFGKVQRQRTNGRYWTELLQKEYISKSSADVILITDIRYDEYEKDEVYWLKNEMNGKLIHISQYKTIDNVKQYTQAPNNDELKNDPRLIQKSDYLFEWQYYENMSYAQLLNSEEIRKNVEKCIDEVMPGNYKQLIFNY